MLTDKDLKQISERGITKEQIDWQFKVFNDGVPFMKLDRAAVIGDGITRLGDAEIRNLTETYENAGEKTKLKFVPASGAASRMFKALFEYLETDSDEIPGVIREFAEKIEHFAFYEELKEVLAKRGKDLSVLLVSGDYKSIVAALLDEEGMNYGNLPKGLLKFHSYSERSRTAFEEHLVEAAHYAVSDDGIARLHFTVSPEHEGEFKKLLSEVGPGAEQRFGVKFEVGFSVQKPSTDTMAVTPENVPFRNDDGTILFRPGGHGALLHNLNDIQADLIFIKNIDNVVPEKYVDTTVRYKKALGGKLLEIQSVVFGFLKELDGNDLPVERLQEIYDYVRKDLCYEAKISPDFSSEGAAKQQLKKILNRPVRVCGVVQNLGEPGGGPYRAANSLGDITPQIVESSQVDHDEPGQQAIFSHATHFNPVDLVCSPMDYQGNKFDLTRFTDPATCFISSKSKDGKDLKALELPGLWNGAMADWLTLFVEVPIETFNPVKTVNDLLRLMHQ